MMRDAGDIGRKLVAEALVPFRSELARVRAEVLRALTPATRRGHPRRPGPDAASVVVDPRRPSTLDSGAAAALEFGD